jgi:hypothetical protein
MPPVPGEIVVALSGRPVIAVISRASPECLLSWALALCLLETPEESSSFAQRSQFGI